MKRVASLGYSQRMNCEQDIVIRSRTHPPGDRSGFLGLHSVTGKYGGLIGVTPYGFRITPRLEITLSIEPAALKREGKLACGFISFLHYSRG